MVPNIIPLSLSLSCDSCWIYMHAESQGRQYQWASGEASSVASYQEHGRLIKWIDTYKNN
jgi:hypothetical protein